MTIAVLNFNTGEVDIIHNAPNHHTDGGVVLFLQGRLHYNMDEIEYLWNKEHPEELTINEFTYPDDFN